MTKKTKAIRTIAAVTAAALLGGGIYLLVKNDVAQKINWQDILIYAPTPIARETLDEAVNNSSDKPSADRVPEDTKKELTAQVRQLSNEHSDSVAWLYIPGTNIDYPVMQSEDNEYYAHRAADGSYLYAGSLFMDYRCSSDFSDFNSVIYGHNMGNGTMFADIPNYENEEYFMEHSYGWLTTDDNVRLIDFFAVARTTDTSGLYLADPTFEEWDLQLRRNKLSNGLLSPQMTAMSMHRLCWTTYRSLRMICLRIRFLVCLLVLVGAFRIVMTTIVKTYKA